MAARTTKVMVLTLVSVPSPYSCLRHRYARTARMKYSVMWPSLRIVRCQKSICSVDRVGKRYVNAGTMNCDVSLEEKASVEKIKVTTSHRTTGKWYSRKRLFNTLQCGRRRCFRRSQTSRATRVENR